MGGRLADAEEGHFSPAWSAASANSAASLMR